MLRLPNSPCESPGVALEIQRAVRYFDHGKIRALDGVSLTVDIGESLAVTGPSGAGKSTLLNVATGLDVLDSGDISWFGQSIRSRKAWRALRRQRVGIVFQEYHLVPTLTALQNVELALLWNGLSRGERRRSATDLLIEVGLSRRLCSLPNNLSGGERQRVAIARALAGSPSMLLADEPTGNLDRDSTAKILALMMQLRESRKLGLVIVTHDSTVARFCDRSLTIVDGTVSEETRGQAR